MSLVRVPKTGRDQGYSNSREWLDTAIKINGSTTRVANHMFRDYKGPCGDFGDDVDDIVLHLLMEKQPTSPSNIRLAN